MNRRPPRSALCPYTTLFLSPHGGERVPQRGLARRLHPHEHLLVQPLLGAAEVARRRAREPGGGRDVGQGRGSEADRKRTRLNSSHANISYAVFCLKKYKYDQ